MLIEYRTCSFEIFTTKNEYCNQSKKNSSEMTTFLIRVAKMSYWFFEVEFVLKFDHFEAQKISSN